MKAAAEVVSAPAPEGPPAGAPLRLERMAGQAPIAWRLAADAVYLVSTSAWPVGDDEVLIEVRARAGSKLAVRSTAATVAWTGTASRQEIRATVEPGAVLDWAPRPLIATAGCNHTQVAFVDVEAGGTLRWQEIVMLGRHHEQPGSLRSALHVDVDGRPLLRHELSIGTDAWNGPAVLGSSRVAGLVLCAGGSAAPDRESRAGDTWAVTPVEGPGELAFALGDSVTEVERTLDRILPPPW